MVAPSLRVAPNGVEKIYIDGNNHLTWLHDRDSEQMLWASQTALEE